MAIQRNSFGEVVAEYASGVAGEMTGLRSDAMSEPGNPLVFILFNKPAPGEVEALSRIIHQREPSHLRTAFAQVVFGVTAKGGFLFKTFAPTSPERPDWIKS